MKNQNKKNQVIQGYFEEILPYVDYKFSSDNLEFECRLKMGSTEHLERKKIKKYIDYTQVNQNSFLLDFSDSSIKDTYRGLTIIHKEILEV